MCVCFVHPPPLQTLSLSLSPQLPLHVKQVGFKDEEGQASHVLTLQHRNQAPLIAADTVRP